MMYARSRSFSDTGKIQLVCPRRHRFGHKHNGGCCYNAPAMSQRTSRRVPEEKAASIEEVETAIDSLTKRELWRLEQYAKRRIRGIGRSSLGRNYEDLLQQAVTDTLSGSRRWNKEAVDFTRHLVGAMRSISSHWRERFDPDEAYSESEAVLVSHVGRASNPMLDVASPIPDGRRVTEAKAAVERIERLVSGHPLASLIIDGLREGLTGPEIQKTLEISQKEYETAMKWLRRTVRADANKEGRDVK